MICTELLLATQVILHLWKYEGLRLIIVPAKRPLVQLVLQTWPMGYRIVDEYAGGTVVEKEGL